MVLGIGIGKITQYNWNR